MSDDKDKVGAKDVGYCKPPKEHQFKSGQSGNPKGRPKGSKNLLKQISKHAAKKVMVIEGGVEKKMAKMDVVISAMFNKASRGDVSAARLITHLIQAASVLPGENHQSENPFTDDDYASLMDELDWLEKVQNAKKPEQLDGPE
ncbi:hypothetical protein RUE5091_00063 [Ruegeria denitrificans]|uniref:DUF5681 domain-containing protein n=1 Tax=Ruegeria denitrificans TaxID=1715692 RepID=A0A0P1I0G3_9RHOB|nr:DUF5681 domain-containing protein [Ruegeria denitrificans]CUJ83046.1 hypothetical protein RUE5091_00063 [Ruegeria denitrificans]